MRASTRSVLAAGLLVLPLANAQQDAPIQEGSDGLQEPAQRSAGLSITPATARQVQEALSRRGYFSGRIDGSWGQQAEQALKAFQQAQGLEPTGQFDQRTLGALGLASGGSSAGYQG